LIENNLYRKIQHQAGQGEMVADPYCIGIQDGALNPATFSRRDDMTTKKVKLQLVGLDGNAFSLMGAFSRQAKKENWTQEEIKEVLDECKSGDYDHLLETLVDHCE
jgi:hypothetical protein